MKGQYIESFVIPVPEENLEAYKVLAEMSAKVFRELGALEYVECISENCKEGKLTSFPESVRAKEGEKIVLAWTSYPSKEKWYEVHKKFLEHPLMKEFDPAKLPFDSSRMIIGGFEKFIDE